MHVYLVVSRLTYSTWLCYVGTGWARNAYDGGTAGRDTWAHH